MGKIGVGGETRSRPEGESIGKTHLYSKSTSTVLIAKEKLEKLSITLIKKFYCTNFLDDKQENEIFL